MTYNNNIILNILQSNFWDEIEICVADYIISLDEFNLAENFDNIVDYAELDSINEMLVDSYEIKLEAEEDREYISGIIEIECSIDGYVHWDRENIAIDKGIVNVGVQFSFCSEKDKYYDLELELI